MIAESIELVHAKLALDAAKEICRGLGLPIDSDNPLDRQRFLEECSPWTRVRLDHLGGYMSDLKSTIDHIDRLVSLLAEKNDELTRRTVMMRAANALVASAGHADG